MTDIAGAFALPKPQPVKRRAGEGMVHTILGMRHRYKLLASESRGHFMVMDLIVPPGCGAPMHAHDVDTEAFYMLEGEITATDEHGERTVLRPGDFIWFPANHPHSFTNMGKGNARALVIQSPGTDGENFFNGLASAQQRADFTPERDVAALGARHGVNMRLPELA